MNAGEGEQTDMGKKKEKHLKKLDKLKEVMHSMVDSEFTGHVKINFSQGGIGRIEKFEEILREEDCSLK